LLVREVNRDPDAISTLTMRIYSPIDTDISTTTTIILRGETGSRVSGQLIADEQM